MWKVLVTWQSTFVRRIIDGVSVVGSGRNEGCEGRCWIFGGQ